MRFEWDTDKELSNIRKHGVDFDTALKVFNDPLRIVWFDKDHSDYEDRYLTIGVIQERPRILFVSYVNRDDVVRIISARKATARERRMYNDCK